MKKSIKIFVLLFLCSFFYTQAQVRVGGGVSVDINVPDIVIGNPKPAPAPRRAPKRRPRPVPQPVPAPRPIPRPAPRPIPRPVPRVVHSFGTIDNHNRPGGSYTYQVVGASIQAQRDGTESVFYELNNGETLELIIATVNPNDFNYNFQNHHHNGHSNAIVAVYLNNVDLPVQSAHISLAPNQYGYQSVINITSIYEGGFHGNINF